jgi:hypothetical protein
MLGVPQGRVPAVFSKSPAAARPGQVSEDFKIGQIFWFTVAMSFFLCFLRFGQSLHGGWCLQHFLLMAAPA